MVIGNPHSFAFIIDLVPEWNVDPRFKMGIFQYVLNGKVYPHDLDAMTLSSELYYFFTYKPVGLLDIRVHKTLFDLDKEEAFSQLIEEHVNNEGNQLIYNCTSLSLRDSGYEFFAVSDGEYLRIIKGNMGMDYSFSEVEEVIVSIDYVKDIVSRLECFYKERIM